MLRRIGPALLFAIGVTIACAPRVCAQLPADQMTTLALGEPNPDWVYVLDIQFPVALINKVWIIDGDSRKLVGQLSAGYLANFEISPDHREMYTVDTYYSRGWRGTRTDVVTIFDAKTTNVIGEIAIPSKRILIVPKRNTTSITPDGRFLLIANMTPPTSVSVVDLKTRKFVGEIETSGCAQVTATANRKFFSMCDGAFLTVQIDDAGRKTSVVRGKPLFDANQDPIFDQPAMAGDKAYFVTYHGNVLAVDFSGTEAAVQAQWNLLTPDDVAKKWRPGGWQTVAFQRTGGMLYVLMHQGGEWTHKQFGTEVWVFDVQSHKRVRRIKLKTPGYSIMVSQADKPLLFNLSLVPSRLETYSTADGKYQGVYDGIGSPFLLYGP